MQSLMTRTLAIIGLYSTTEVTGGTARRKAPKARRIRFESLEPRLACDDGADIFVNAGDVLGALDFGSEEAPTLINALDGSLTDIVFSG